MKRHSRFEWNPDKASRNLRRHKVSFDDGAAVLADPYFESFHVEAFDEDHSTESEDRWITTGAHPQDRAIILVVTWTERYDDEGSVTRIITARHITRAERVVYEDEIQRR